MTPERMDAYLKRWIPTGIGPSQQAHFREALIAEALDDAGPGDTNRTPLRLRRDPFPEPRILQVRVDLDRAQPPIWRRLQIRSDITLDVLHEIFLDVGSWDDDHLHEFWIGGRYLFDSGAGEIYSVSEQFNTGREEADEATVRLDEILQEPGDKLHYEYDFGAAWHLVAKLEKVLPATPESPLAACTGGRSDFPDEFGNAYAFDKERLNKVLSQYA